MNSQLKLVVDSSVVEDVLRNSKPDVNGSAGILSVIEAGFATGVLCAADLLHLHDIISAELSPAESRSILSELMDLMEIAGTSREIIDKAMALGWADLRAAIKAGTALKYEATHLVTRTPRRFRSLHIQVMTPEEFMARHSSDFRAM